MKPEAIREKYATGLPENACQRLYLGDRHELFCLYFGDRVEHPGESELIVPPAQ